LIKIEVHNLDKALSVRKKKLENLLLEKSLAKDIRLREFL